MDPQDQLALDEALLLLADEATDPQPSEPAESSSLPAESVGGEALRVWQFDRPVVVLGRSSRVSHEIDRQFCAEANIPVLRRCSGGATIVGGPGCLMYSVVLNLGRDGGLQKIDMAHQYVMTRLRAAVGEQLTGVQFQGTCDLTWRNQKFSGNSLRVARRHLLYHGTILYAADLDLTARCLTDAPRQPEYRNGRAHQNFITNVAIDPRRLRCDLSTQFQLPLLPFADGGLDSDPAEKFVSTASPAAGRAEAIGGTPHRVAGTSVAGSIPERIASRMQALRRQRYANPAWNLRH